MCTRPDSACAAGRADFSLYGYTKEAHHYTALVASILVAEDNPLNFELVRDVLQAGGHIVHWAKDGADAIERLRSHHVDLVPGDTLVLEVSDDGPGMDGSAPPRGYGFGLRSVRERMRSAGPPHALAIHSARGSGTCIRVTLPYRTLEAGAP